MQSIISYIKSIFNGSDSDSDQPFRLIQIHTGSNLCMAPFFEPDISQNLKYQRSLSSVLSNDKNILDALTECKHTLGPSIRDIYLGINSWDHGFIVNDWCFFSVKEIDSMMKKHSDQTNKKMIDIALTYCGMGHVIILSYIPNTDKFFFRQDGGANGYEREDNYDRYENENFKPSDLPAYNENISHMCKNQKTKEKNKLQILVQYDYHDLMRIIDPQWIFLYKN